LDDGVDDMRGELVEFSATIGDDIIGREGGVRQPVE
jgi:hypothetical protein